MRSIWNVKSTQIWRSQPQRMLNGMVLPLHSFVPRSQKFLLLASGIMGCNVTILGQTLQSIAKCMKAKRREALTTLCLSRIQLVGRMWKGVVGGVEAWFKQPASGKLFHGIDYMFCILVNPLTLKLYVESITVISGSLTTSLANEQQRREDQVDTLPLTFAKRQMRSVLQKSIKSWSGWQDISIGLILFRLIDRKAGITLLNFTTLSEMEWKVMPLLMPCRGSWIEDATILLAAQA